MTDPWATVEDSKPEVPIFIESDETIAHREADIKASWDRPLARWEVEEKERNASKEILARQMNRFANNLTRSDTILSGLDLKVLFVDGASRFGSPLVPNAPSWTNGETIWFNANVMGLTKPMDNDDIIRVNGLNYHELAHVLYTPRPETSWGKYVMAHPKMHPVANILEDARIERMLIAMYPSVQPYLHAVVLKFILGQSPKVLENAQVLIYGRRYLPQDIRDGVRDLWPHGNNSLQKLEHWIDRYITIPDVSDSRVAKTAIREITELLNSLRATVPPSPYGHNAERNSVVPDKGDFDADEAVEASEWADFNEEEKKLDEEAEQEVKDAATGKSKSKKEDDTEDDADSDGGFAEDEEEGDDDTDEGEDSDDTDEAGSDGGEDSEDADVESGDEGTDGDDSDDDDDSDSGLPADSESAGDDSSDGGDDANDDSDGGSGESDNGVGTGAGTGSSYDNAKKVTDSIKDALDDIASSHDVKHEVNEKSNYINIDDGTVIGLPRASYYDEPVSPQMRLIADRFAEVLMQMRTDSDPGWTHGQPSGRINMQKAMMTDDIDTVWDRWDADKQDSTRIAAALAIDSSGSMDGRMTLACATAWAIKHAVESIEGTTSIANFNGSGTLLYGPDERADAGTHRAVYAGGGTCVAPTVAALESSLRVMHEPNKMLFVLTDGGFMDHGVAKEVFEKARADGITTVLIGLGTTGVYQYKDVVDHVGYISRLEELIPFAQKFVTAQLLALPNQ